MTEPIITSLLDTDLYKLTMMQVVFHQFREAKALYRFQCRNVKPNAFLKKQVESQVRAFAGLTFQPSDLEFLASLLYFKSDFLDYLQTFSLAAEHVQLATHHDQLTVTIEGPWLETILFEVPLLAIISELYGQSVASENQMETAHSILQQKIDVLKSIHEKGFGFTDFGTRRRFSHAWHHEVLKTFIDQVPGRLIGTSNVMFAKELGLPAVGTMAHEFLQACQVLAPNLQTSQRFALESWANEYPNDLSIALTDTLGFDVFIREFDASLAKRYQGLRQDSGSPFAWTEKALAMYQELGVPTHDKTFIYSDRLTFDKAYALYKQFHTVCHPGFGIGTYVTNDVGLEPLDAVIKLHRLNGVPVVKLSDSPGKEVCDDQTYLIDFKKKLGL